MINIFKNEKKIKVKKLTNKTMTTKKELQYYMSEDQCPCGKTFCPDYQIHIKLVEDFKPPEKLIGDKIVIFIIALVIAVFPAFIIGLILLNMFISFITNPVVFMNNILSGVVTFINFILSAIVFAFTIVFQWIITIFEFINSNTFIELKITMIIFWLMLFLITKFSRSFKFKDIIFVSVFLFVIVFPAIYPFTTFTLPVSNSFDNTLSAAIAGLFANIFPLIVNAITGILHSYNGFTLVLVLHWPLMYSLPLFIKIDNFTCVCNKRIIFRKKFNHEKAYCHSCYNKLFGPVEDEL